MPDTFAIIALHRKRARVAGEVELLEEALAKQRDALATVDAVLRMFEPGGNPELIRAIRPRSRRNPFFKRGEQPRLCIDVLRNEAKPVSGRYVTQCLLDLKGLQVDPLVRREIAEQVRQVLHRLAARGSVRKIIKWPELWWELVVD